MTDQQRETIKRLSGLQLLQVQKKKQWNPDEAKKYWDFWREHHLGPQPQGIEADLKAAGLELA